MKEICLMQRVLGEDWRQLPEVLKRHHRDQGNRDQGHLDIEYPAFMQGYLNFLFRLGALLNHRGTRLPARVNRFTDANGQYRQRVVQREDGQILQFDSRWEKTADHQIIEYINAFWGLKMKLWVDDGLCYEGIHLILKIGPLKLPIPEWLLLGHTSIREEAVDDEYFHMDFRLQHPWLGELYRYEGSFRTGTLSEKNRPG
jgi:hypothetical protein